VNLTRHYDHHRNLRYLILSKLKILPNLKIPPNLRILTKLNRYRLPQAEPCFVMEQNQSAPAHIQQPPK
jgi:hypothetical protein